MSAVHTAYLLSQLGPHSREHAVRLLARFPGLHLTSTRRTPERNRAVGGVAGSFHVRGRAADFTGTPKDLKEAAEWAFRQRVGRRCTGPEEVIVHNAGSGLHLHVAW